MMEPEQYFGYITIEAVSDGLPEITQYAELSFEILTGMENTFLGCKCLGRYRG